MRYGRSRLPEIILVAVFGVGGGFYAFQPAFKQLQVTSTTPVGTGEPEGLKTTSPQTK